MFLSPTQIVDIPNNYYLDNKQEKGWLGVILPEESKNFVTNPLIISTPGNPDLPGDGYSKIGAWPITRITENSPYWNDFPRLQPTSTNDRVIYLIPSYMDGTFTFSIVAKASPGETPIIIMYASNGIDILGVSSPIELTENWEQYSVQFTSTVGSSNTQVLIRWDQLGDTDVAGFQVEEKSYMTSFIYGSKNKYHHWAGVPNQSTSYRNKDDIRGGRVVNLKQYNMLLTELEGLGIPDLDHSSIPLALERGSIFHNTTIESRDYDISFQIFGCSLKELLSHRNSLGRAIFTPNLPRIFLYQPLDCGIPIGPCVQFAAIYESGYSQELNAFNGEEITINLVGYDVEIELCNTICNPLSLTEEIVHQSIIASDLNGDINTLLGGLPTPNGGFITSMVVSEFNGFIYVGTSAGSTGPEIWCYDGSAWERIAKGFLGTNIQTLASNGPYIYVGFERTNNLIASGTWSGSSGLGTAKLDISTETIINIGNINATIPPAGGTPTVYAIEVNTNTQQVYFGGNFGGIGGVASRHAVMYSEIAPLWNVLAPSQPTLLGQTNGYVRALAYDKIKRQLYIGGDFDNGIAAPTFDTPNPNTFAIWDEITNDYIPVRPDMVVNGVTLGGRINALAIYNDRVVAGGQFTNSLRGLPNPKNIVWFDPTTGTSTTVDAAYGSLKPLAEHGVDNITGGVDAVYDLQVIDDTLYIAGKLTYYGPLDSSGAIINPIDICGVLTYTSPSSDLSGGTFAQPDLNMGEISVPSPAAACFVNKLIGGNFTTNTSVIYTNPSVTLGTDFTSSFSATTEVMVCNEELDVAPTLYIRGGGILKSITNVTTNSILLFDEVIIQDNELITINLSELPIQVISGFYGDITHRLLPTSSPSTWKLVPGINYIAVKVDSPSTTYGLSFLCYRPQAFAAEALICSSCR